MGARRVTVESGRCGTLLSLALISASAGGAGFDDAEDGGVAEGGEIGNLVCAEEHAGRGDAQAESGGRDRRVRAERLRIGSFGFGEEGY